MNDNKKRGRPPSKDGKRLVVSLHLKEEVLIELDNLAFLFNKKTKLGFSRTKFLELIIMNDAKNIINQLNDYHVFRNQEYINEE